VIAHRSLSDSDIRRTSTGQNDQDAGSSTAPEHLDAGWSTPISSTHRSSKPEGSPHPMAGQQGPYIGTVTQLDGDVSVTRPVATPSDLRPDSHCLIQHQEVQAA
jgi:hypothetical protein